MSPVEQIADAILYEGYILYPYRASALKNGQRWNFGVLYPPEYAAAQCGSDSSTAQCECLARGSGVGVTVRFLQLVTRDRLDANGSVVHTWQEALTREVDVSLDAAQTTVVRTFEFTADVTRETAPAGEIVRTQERLEGAVEIGIQIVDAPWFRVRVRISNVEQAVLPPALQAHRETGDKIACSTRPRETALRRSLVSTHAILRVTGGEFASLLDPPGDLREATAACTNTGLWPVLVGEARDTMLASPIILYDYPQIAPESAGALFDGTEIDEILSLRILALTDEEKREMRETDPQARRILERTESLAPEQWMQLHGLMRSAR